MTASSDVIVVVSGTPNTVQFWADTKTAGITAKSCVAYMSDISSAALLRIAQDCPREVQDRAIATFAEWRDGRPVRGTHTVVWEHGRPSFTVLAVTT